MSTETQTDRLTSYRTDVETGQTFRLHAASARSRYGYQPPVERRTYAHAIQVLGKMAAESDPLTQIASQIVGRLNPYGTDADLEARLYECAAEALYSGYDDVIGRSGPEVGRHKDYQRDFTVAERVQLHCWLAAANGDRDIGWALRALAGETGVDADRILKAGAR